MKQFFQSITCWGIAAKLVVLFIIFGAVPMAAVGFIAFFLFCMFMYHWKSDAGIPIKAWFKENNWFLQF